MLIKFNQGRRQGKSLGGRRNFGDPGGSAPGGEAEAFLVLKSW